MILPKEEQEGFRSAAKPLIAWLNAHGHPHCRVIVDAVSAELCEGVSRVITYAFVRDKGEPVVVESDASANEMNELHGERYGIDWVYPSAVQNG